MHLHSVSKYRHLVLTCSYDRTRHRFYWSGLYKPVLCYGNACDSGQRHKSPPVRPAGQRLPIDVATELFHRVGLNILDSIQESTSGHKWVEVATDYKTRFPITRTLPTSCVAAIADFLLRDIILQPDAC